MNRIQNEITDKLATIADRIVIHRRAVEARRAYHLIRPDADAFAQEVATALGIPVTRDGQVVVDSGYHSSSRYIWASFLIEDYRIEQMRSKVGVWDERAKDYIMPSGTVKQGRRPMFKPFADLKGDNETK